MISIIILLILATVSIQVLTGDNGLLIKGRLAVEEYNKGENKERNQLIDMEYELAKNDGTYTGSYDSYVLEKKYGLKVGDYVNYETFIPEVTLTDESQIMKDLNDYSGCSDNTISNVTQQLNLGWRILDIKDGKIRLISSAPTNSYIKLMGADGYNNGVFLLDEVCNQLYSSNKGISSNLKIEDIENKLKYNYNSYINSYSVQYGQEKEYISSTNYPKIFKNEKACIKLDNEDNNGLLEPSIQSKEHLIRGTDSAKIVCKQSAWEKLMTSEDFKDSVYYNLIINNNGTNYDSYWLSSRTINCGLFYPYYYVKGVINGKVTNSYAYDRSHDNGYGYMKLRPTVILSADSKITKDDTHDGTTKAKACIIE